MAALEIIDEHVRSFNSHDANAWAARYAPDVVIHDPQYPEPLRGRAAAQKDVEDFFAAFPDIQFTVTNKTGTGDLAALVTIPPGHDAWVEGNESFVGIEVMSAEIYAKPA